MSLWPTIFWLCAALVLYTYAIYPLIVWALVRLRGPHRHESGIPSKSVSIVIAARNEETAIYRRVGELVSMIESAGVDGEVIVVSDGSTDATVTLAQRAGGARVRVLQLPASLGKAAALNAGCAASAREIVIFADARQRWATDAVSRLLANFADPRIGAVSGNLVLESSSGAVAGVGLYWRYEKWLRGQESRLSSVMGVSGSISAVRRDLFALIPNGTILDDVYWPMCVAMSGYRIVLDESAKAFDQLPARPTDEFRRKVRTLAGNFQLAMRLPRSLLPWKNPIWFQFVSHKLCRLPIPWVLAALLILAAMLHGTIYTVALWSQLLFYGFGITGMITGSRVKLLSAASAFLMLNGAAWLAFWVWITGRCEKAWRKANYAAAEVG
jgi:cellulose synthase/poly-beta-1,6-N-acetylglucosamine synthase-like glycosyltransferase